MRHARIALSASPGETDVSGSFRLQSLGAGLITLSVMRHVWTMIAAVIIAPLDWVLLAYGQDRSLQAFANQDNAHGLAAGDFIRPTLCLAAAGLLLGLIATMRFSPLGAVLAGTAYAGSYVALLVNPDAALDLLPNSVSVAGRSADLTTPLRTGATLFLGALLLVAVASRDRWRRWPSPDTEAPDQTDNAPAISLDDRPLGLDGLDLAPVRHGAHERSPELAWADRNSGPRPSDWPPSRPS